MVNNELSSAPSLIQHGMLVINVCPLFLYCALPALLFLGYKVDHGALSGGSWSGAIVKLGYLGYRLVIL